MAKVDVLNWDKKKVGQVELSADVFEQPVKKAVLHSLVKWQLASRRSGTHKALSKGEVRGGGKKPFKQKGTGSARQGSIRSLLMRGGGVAFPPKPRDYSYSVPKKMKQLGFKCALSHLLGEGKLFILDEISLTEGKTKELSARLKGFGLDKAVLIDETPNDKMTRASRNMSKFRYYSVEGMNVYDLLRYDAAIISKNSIDKIVARCGVEK
jgi:large subunit ribosomal protein L4